ncbi:hypothetical protein MMC28_001339 [Mycoblastus sanguinarius]|nr:hypothetical protein [Mycoblastus sanguinarius]
MVEICDEELLDPETVWIVLELAMGQCFPMGQVGETEIELLVVEELTERKVTENIEDAEEIEKAEIVAKELLEPVYELPVDKDVLVLELRLAMGQCFPIGQVGVADEIEDADEMPVDKGVLVLELRLIMGQCFPIGQDGVADKIEDAEEMPVDKGVLVCELSSPEGVE